ncbi:hypothetical protein [Cytophaga aurantiaca]|uniref:hypothetical protein n=1 Tax=Cytophaga aurantiaca TaxID=29530 RepID=UPI000364C203|nr:hypothetical protein [Cytophaga aurantiaca]
MKIYIKAVVGILFIAGIHFSCKREFEKPRWDTKVLAPLVKSKLTIRDIIKDSTQVETEVDHSISLVNRQQIFTYTIDSLVSLEAPQFKRTVKLSSLVLSDQTITRAISLGQIALQLKNQGNPLGDQIILAGKLGFPIPFPGVNDITAGPISIDISQFFKTADLLSGQMIVSVKNGLPLTISNLQFSLNNNTPPSVITTQTFTNILPSTTQSKTQDLSGKTIGSTIDASIDDMDIAPGTVIIDTSDALLLTLSISNIKVFSATAIFPEQEVVNETSNVELIGLNNVELTETIIRQGTVHADVYSTAEDTVRFTYEIPAATKNGQTFKFDAVVPPAPANGTSHVVFDTDFSGYLMDLTGTDGTKYNTFYNVLKGKINYTGRLVHLSLDDSLDMTLTLVDPKPSYIKGYLGEDALDVGPGNIDVNIFKNISATTLDFSSAAIDIVFENALGIPAEATLDNLTAYNSKTGANVSLTGTPVNQSYPIAPATEGGGFPVSVQSTIDLSTGSNAISLLNILPDKFSYAGIFQFNPAGKVGNPHTDFAYSGVDLKAFLDIKIPLSVIAANMVLSDTAAFDIPALKTAGFQEGKFNLLVWNGFPFDVKVDMRFLDQYGVQVDSIITTNTILAAPIDAGGKVVSSKYSVVSFQLSAAEVNTLTNLATQVVFTARFDTKPVNTHVSIYDDYSIDFKLVGDMNIQVNSGQ